MMEDISNKNKSINDDVIELAKTVSQSVVSPTPSIDVSAPAPSEPEDLDNRWNRWKCLVCGYVYEGAVPLQTCPKCGNNNPDKFDDAE